MLFLATATVFLIEGRKLTPKMQFAFFARINLH